MKLKTILLTATTLLGILSSCSEESLVGPAVGSGEDAILSVNLSIKEEVASKADIGYEAPTSDNEKLMNNYVIAVFDAAGTTRLGFAQDKFSPAKKEFTVEVVAKGGNNRQVLTIANLTEEQYANCAEYKTLDEFKNLVASQTEAFKSENLMKVKLQNVNLTAGQVNSFPIELVQLPARVDVAIDFSAEDKKAGASFDITEFSVAGINTLSDVVLTNVEAVTNTQNPTNSSLSYKNADSPVQNFSFYTYEKSTANAPVTITITGLLKEKTGDEGVQKTYKYVLNPTISGDCKTVGIVHGNVYALHGLMNLTTKTLTFNVTTRAWNPIEVGAAIKDMHYLFVKEHLVYMSNIDYYEIDFAADLTIQESSVIVKYPYYKKDGSVIKSDTAIINNSNDPQYPTINVNNADKKIEITSPKPTNYFAKIITFDVTNGDGLTESVKVIQYPALYMEGEVSKGGDKSYLPSTSKPSENPNLFTVTTIAADGYKVGVHTNADGTTMDDAESNQLVSPKFLVSSRYAVVSSGTYTRAKAIERCKTYWETTDANKTGNNATYPPGKWRLPTVRELQLLYQIQTDGLLAGTLFYTDNSNSAYWSAQKSWYVKFYDGKAYDRESDDKVISGSGGIRCVYDLY